MVVKPHLLNDMISSGLDGQELFVRPWVEDALRLRLSCRRERSRHATSVQLVAAAVLGMPVAFNNLG